MNIITSLGTGNNNNNNDKPMSYEEIERWTVEKMDKMLGIDSREMAKYVLSMSTNSDIESYLSEILDSTKKSQTFIEQLIKKINSLPRRVQTIKVTKPPTNQTNNLKNKTTTTTTTTSTGNKPTKQQIRSFKEIEIEMKPGEPCDCQATRHKLLTNCLNCGKIMCEQDAGHSKKCSFCSTPLFTNPINLSTQQQQLVEKNLNNAVEYKDRILGYQNTHAKRTMVYDDQEDYFSNSTNKWLTEEERKKVAQQEQDFKQKQEDYKKTTKISIDFQGRRIISAPVDKKLFEFEKISLQGQDKGSHNQQDEYKSIQDFKSRNAEIDNNLGKDVKYSNSKHDDKKRSLENNSNGGRIVLGSGGDDLITKQYYGVEEDIVVFNSKEVLSNLNLKYRGIMEGLWFDTTTIKKRLPNLSTYKKYIENLKENGCNFISISPQNYINQEFQFIGMNSGDSNNNSNTCALPNQIREFLKQLIDFSKKDSNDNNSIKINISILIPREFEFSNENNLKLLKNIIEMYIKIGIKSFSLILPSGWNDSFTLPICAPNSTKSEVNNSKTYSQTQTAFLVQLYKQYKESVEFIICPSMFELNLSGTPPSRQQIEYWLEINKSTPPSYPILFTTLAGSLQNSTLSKIKNIFDKRDLIVIEKYPYKNINNNFTTQHQQQQKSMIPIQWDPYHCAFDDYKSFLCGVLASPFDAEFYLDDLTTMITLCTTFIQYLKSPFNYQSELSLRATLVNFTDGNEEVADCLANLILALSNGVFDQINSVVLSNQLEKQQQQQDSVKKDSIDPRDRIFFENLISYTTIILDCFNNLNDPLFDHLNLIKKTLLNYLD
ncbi:hypothetical protein RB653_006881 [Dictyostelium firmibasis]|uniref:GH84 domain-containing protein n=1 Tax=Dictyostelium firmibasis TaxID=79012 RepID=A0AAN7TKX4_9MYCE